MKNLAKRSLSMLLVLAMCISLLSGLTFTVSADNVTYRYSSEGYIYNWGERGTTATFLSQNAEAFYSDRNTSYAELSKLSGSSNRDSVPSSALYQELQALMHGAQTYTTSYDATKTMYQYTDCQLNGSWNSGKISSFYTGVGIGPAWDGGGTWNREHTWPNSKGDASGQGENDIMMLRPTSKSENSSRGNTAYGEGSSYYDPNSESNGKYDLRGDVARIMLFVYTRWGNTGSMWSSTGVIESKEVLLKWIEADPVDTWELGRNDSVESITGTRNVYVDYPELAFLLFNEEIPAGYDSPSGESAGSAYTITATSSNTSHGTVSVSGKTVNASPKTGYYAAGYTVVSGSATVTQNGNAFTVEAASDCTVRINFAARAQVSVSFSENGTTTSQQTVYAGDKFNLPAASNVPAGFSFLGWVTGAVAETTQMPTYLAASSEYTPTANTTLYALYSRTESGGTGPSTVFEKYTDTTLVEGDYILTYKTTDVGAMKAELTDKNRMAYTVISVTDDTILNPDATIIWHIAPSGTSYTIFNEATSSYASAASSNDKVALLSTQSNKSTWSVKIASGTFDFTNTSNSRLLRRNTTFGFSCYSTSTGGALTLYKGISGTAYYTTSATSCTHSNTENVAEVPATCTAEGYTAGVYCNDCETYISGHEVLPMRDHDWDVWVQTAAPGCETAGVETRACQVCRITETQPISATGHSYTSVVTPPTATEPGCTTHTCGNCGDSYTDATTYLVSFSVPEGTASVDPMTGGAEGITLPTAAAPEGYTFVGWTDAAVTDTTSKPTVYTDSFSPTDCTTLYALYSYVEAGESTGSGDYVKVTEAPADWSGEYVMTATISGDTYMFLADGTTPNTIDAAKLIASTGMSVNGDKLEGVTDSYVIVVEQLGSNYVLRLKGASSDTYLMTLNSNSGFNTATGTSNTNVQWTMSWDNGEVKIANVEFTSRTIRFNSSSKQFRTYTSGQKPITLYKKDGAAGTTHYTTTIGEAVKISDASVTLDSVLGVNFKTNAPAGCTVTVQVGDAQPITVNGSNGVFTVHVFAQDMMCDIAATLCDAQGNELDSVVFKLADYVTGIAANDPSKALANAALAYCQYAAAVKGNYDGDMNQLAAIPEGAFDEYTVEASGTVSGVKAFAYLEDACQIGLRLPAGEGYAVTVDGQTAAVSESTCYSPELLPQDYDKTYTFAVTKDGQELCQVRISVMAYLGMALKRGISGDNGDMENLLLAMYHYWAAAEAYVAANPAA